EHAGRVELHDLHVLGVEQPGAPARPHRHGTDLTELARPAAARADGPQEFSGLGQHPQVLVLPVQQREPVSPQPDPTWSKERRVVRVAAADLEQRVPTGACEAALDGRGAIAELHSGLVIGRTAGKAEHAEDCRDYRRSEPSPAAAFPCGTQAAY